MGRAALQPDEERRAAPGRRAAARARRASSSRLTRAAADDPVDQPGQRHDRQQDAGDVEPARGRVPGLGDEGERADDAEDGDRDADEEDRAPPEVLEDGAAGQRPARDGDARRSRPRCRWPGRARPGGKTLLMTARVVGWTAAPPTPMTARQRISSTGLLLKAASTEPEREDASAR